MCHSFQHVTDSKMGKGEKNRDYHTRGRGLIVSIAPLDPGQNSTVQDCLNPTRSQNSALLRKYSDREMYIAMTTPSAPARATERWKMMQATRQRAP